MKSLDVIREKKVLIIFLIALLVVFLYLMKPFLLPMILSMITAVIFFPLFDRINKKLRQKSRLSSLVTTLIVFFIIILPSTWVVAILINQLYTFVGHLDLSQTFSTFFSTDFYSGYVDPWLQDIENRYHININLVGVLTDFGKTVAKYIYSYSPTVLLGTFNFIFNFFIMMVGIYFLFLEGPKLLRIFYEISPLRETHERRLLKRVRDTIDASVYGYLVTGLFQGIVAGIVFLFVGLKAFVILGTLTFFMSMVPIIGAAGVWIPVCIWLFLQGQTWQAVVVLISGVAIISMIDNFIKPIVIEGKTKIHPLLIFFSLFGGIQLFGPLGILIGPVTTALLIATINIFREEFA